jgi:chitinase
MSPSTFTRAAIAAGLLASSASAAYDKAAKTNIAMYWGQGYAQIPLMDVCTDPSIDIVNIGCK